MKKTCIITLLLVIIYNSLYPQTIAVTAPEDTSGLYMAPQIKRLSPKHPVRVDYLDLQRRRTRNRTLLDLALNYSPLSFVTSEFLDPYHPKRKNYILNADLAPQIAIGGEWMRFPILLSPRYMVRILGDDPRAGDVSEPVRTPSFMPGLTIFIPLQHQMTEESRTVYFGSIAVFHHSNGQDHPEFYPNGAFNKYNGNFSTDYIEPSYWHRSRCGGEVATDGLVVGIKNPWTDFFYKISYLKYFSTDEPLKASYGSGRINIGTGWIRVGQWIDKLKGSEPPVLFNKPYSVERYRVLFNVSYITGTRTLGLDKFEKRFNTEGSFNYKIPETPNVAAQFAVGYYGSDPYNIYYSDNYFYARIGISMGLFLTPKREKLER